MEKKKKIEVVKDYLQKRVLLKDAQNGSLASAYSYIHDFGEENPEKAKQMAEIIINNWQNGNQKRDISFDKILEVAEKYSLEGKLENDIKEIVQSVEKFTKNEYALSIFSYVFKRNKTMKKEYEILENVMIDTIFGHDGMKHVNLAYYLSLLEENNLKVSDKAYEKIVNDKYNVSKILTLWNSYPHVMDYRQVFRDKLQNLREEKGKNNSQYNNDKMSDLIESYLRHNVFDEEETKGLIRTTMETAGLEKVQRYIVWQMSYDNWDVEKYGITLKILEDCVVRGKMDDYASQVAQIDGIDAKRIEKMVLAEKDFDRCYEYAMNVKGADLQKFMDVMMENVPSVSVETVSRQDAYSTLVAGERMAQQMYDVLPSNEISEDRIHAQMVHMQNREIERAENRINGIHKKIRDVSAKLNEQKEREQLKENKKEMMAQA